MLFCLAIMLLQVGVYLICTITMTKTDKSINLNEVSSNVTELQLRLNVSYRTQ